MASHLQQPSSPSLRPSSFVINRFSTMARPPPFAGLRSHTCYRACVSDPPLCCPPSDHVEPSKWSCGLLKTTLFPNPPPCYATHLPSASCISPGEPRAPSYDAFASRNLLPLSAFWTSRRRSPLTSPRFWTASQLLLFGLCNVVPCILRCTGRLDGQPPVVLNPSRAIHFRNRTRWKLST